MIITRDAGREDESFLYELYVSTRQDEVKAWGWGGQETRLFLHMQWTMQTRSYHLQYPDACNQMICYDGQLAGRLLTHQTPKSIRLVDISLHTSFRNLGIGSALLLQLQQEAAEKDIPIYLSVTPENPALKLYERLGFTTYSKSDLYWNMTWSK